MDFTAIKNALSKFTYKPGWTFEAFEHPFEGVWLRITTDLENAYSPSTITTVGINSPIPPNEDEEHFYRWLQYRLVRIETHEVNEWFKVDGEAIYDPHEELDVEKLL